MYNIPNKINTWQMVQDTNNKYKLKYNSISLPSITEKDVLIKIAGCGVCHTDLSFFYDGVQTITKPPLTLGHEISGTIIISENDKLIGKNVIIPAVMPCNTCNICKCDRGNRCLSQKMPGNSLDIYGGFSDYIVVQNDNLCIIDELKYPLSHYAVIADAVTTPYQACMRADIQKNDLVIVVGSTGGIGGYTTQIAKALGAKIVVGLDIKQNKLEKSLTYGVDYILNTKNKSIKDIYKEFVEITNHAGVPKNIGWKIFECTGTEIGQEISLKLLGFIGKLIIIGFGMQKNTYMLSKLMAYDAEIIGTWGCLPKYYSNVLKFVQDKLIQIQPFIETKPLSMIEKVFEDQHLGIFEKRQILEPDF